MFLSVPNAILKDPHETSFEGLKITRGSTPRPFPPWTTLSTTTTAPGRQHPSLGSPCSKNLNGTLRCVYNFLGITIKEKHYDCSGIKNLCWSWCLKFLSNWTHLSVSKILTGFLIKKTMIINKELAIQVFK